MSSALSRHLIDILTYYSADSPEGKVIALRDADVSQMHSATALFISSVAHVSYIIESLSFIRLI